METYGIKSAKEIMKNAFRSIFEGILLQGCEIGPLNGIWWSKIETIKYECQTRRLLVTERTEE
jgi:hypothetical protein